MNNSFDRHRDGSLANETGSACFDRFVHLRALTVGPGTVTRHYAYDDAGNRSDPMVDADDRARIGGRQYNGMGQLMQVNAATGPPFGATWTFGYDVLGRLRTTTLHRPFVPPEAATTYEYDPLGRLTAIHPGSGSSVQEQHFIYRDALNPVAWLRAHTANPCPGSSGNDLDSAYFVYASMRNTPDLMYLDLCNDGAIDATYRMLSDERGSVRAVFELGGSTVQTITYDAWGFPTFDGSDPLQPFGFIGGIWDQETGFWHLGARDYDPSIGRWTTEDPIGFGGGINLYAYCANDPVNCTDPSGLIIPVIVGRILLGAGIGGIIAGGIEAYSQYSQYGGIVDPGAVGTAAAAGAFTGAFGAYAAGTVATGGLGLSGSGLFGANFSAGFLASMFQGLANSAFGYGGGATCGGGRGTTIGSALLNGATNAIGNAMAPGFGAAGRAAGLVGAGPDIASGVAGSLMGGAPSFNQYSPPGFSPFVPPTGMDAGL